jgi:predicted solute-binding protein
LRQLSPISAAPVEAFAYEERRQDLLEAAWNDVTGLPLPSRGEAIERSINEELRTILAVFPSVSTSISC